MSSASQSSNQAPCKAHIPCGVSYHLGSKKCQNKPSDLPKSRLPIASERRNIEMHGGPDAKQHSDDTCAKDVKGAAGVTAGLPMDYISTIAE